MEPFRQVLLLCVSRPQQHRRLEVLHCGRAQVDRVGHKRLNLLGQIDVHASLQIPHELEPNEPKGADGISGKKQFWIIMSKSTILMLTHIQSRDPWCRLVCTALD